MDVVLPIVSHEPLMVLLKMSAQTCVVAVDVEPDCAKMALPFEGESGSAIVLPEIFNCRIAAPLERPRIPKPPTWRMSLPVMVAASEPLPLVFRSMPLQF